MENHLSHAIRSSVRTIVSDCSENKFEIVVSVINKTLLDSDKMKFWDDLFLELDDYEKKPFYSNGDKKTLISCSEANNTMKRGRHDLPFKDKNGKVLYLDAMAQPYRSKYIGYSDNIPLAQVVAGLKNKSIEDAKKLNKEHNEYRYNEFGKALRWFNRDLLSDIDRIKAKDENIYLLKYIKKDIEDLSSEIFSMTSYSINKNKYINLKSMDSFYDELKDITKKENLNIADCEKVHKIIEKKSKSLLLKENKVNYYIYNTFKENLKKKSKNTFNI